jgi:hypothetical protein
MIHDTVLRRILFLGTGLIIAVVLIMALVVIPSVRMDTSPHATPERALPAFGVVVIIHLLIIAALVSTIKVNKQRGQINKVLLVVAGVVPIIFSLVILDAACAYIDNPDTHSAAIFLFVCI